MQVPLMRIVFWSGRDLPAGFLAGDSSASGGFEHALGAQASLEACFIRL